MQDKHRLLEVGWRERERSISSRFEGEVCDFRRRMILTGKY
jgi:hypothetical protein